MKQLRLLLFLVGAVVHVQCASYQDQMLKFFMEPAGPNHNVYMCQDDNLLTKGFTPCKERKLVAEITDAETPKVEFALYRDELKHSFWEPFHNSGGVRPIITSIDAVKVQIYVPNDKVVNGQPQYYSLGIKYVDCKGYEREWEHFNRRPAQYTVLINQIQNPKYGYLFIASYKCLCTLPFPLSKTLQGDKDGLHPNDIGFYQPITSPLPEGYHIFPFIGNDASKMQLIFVGANADQVSRYNLRFDHQTNNIPSITRANSEGEGFRPGQANPPPGYTYLSSTYYQSIAWRRPTFEGVTTYHGILTSVDCFASFTQIYGDQMIIGVTGQKGLRALVGVKKNWGNLEYDLAFLGPKQCERIKDPRITTTMATTVITSVPTVPTTTTTTTTTTETPPVIVETVATVTGPPTTEYVPPETVAPVMPDNFMGGRLECFENGTCVIYYDDGSYLTYDEGVGWKCYKAVLEFYEKFSAFIASVVVDGILLVIFAIICMIERDGARKMKNAWEKKKRRGEILAGMTMDTILLDVKIPKGKKKDKKKKKKKRSWWGGKQRSEREIGDRKKSYVDSNTTSYYTCNETLNGNGETSVEP